jgi:UDP-perosamine 4-acetyltransferase
MHQSDLPVIVIGAGDHARVLIDLLQQRGRRILSITDSNTKRQGHVLAGVSVEVSDEIIYRQNPRDVELVNAVGSVGIPSLRSQIYSKFTQRGYRFATLVHPSATVAPGAQVAQGAQVLAGAVVQTRALIGANTIINTKVSVDHDCAIGCHSHLAPGVTLSGNVRIGSTCHLGTGATVIQQVRIGYGVMIAAGAVVVNDLPDQSSVRGVPAKHYS